MGHINGDSILKRPMKHFLCIGYRFNPGIKTPPTLEGALGRSAMLGPQGQRDKHLSHTPLTHKEHFSFPTERSMVKICTR